MTFVFSLEPGFEVAGRVLLLPEKLLDARKCATSRRGACCNGFLGAVEIIPGEGLHVRTKDEVSVAFPNLELMLLRGTNGSADDLEDVRRGATVAVLHSNGDADHGSCTKVASSERRNGGDQATIRKAPRADLNRFEQTRESAARADGVDQIALGEDHRLSRSEIRGDDSQRDAEVFKLPGIENALDQAAETLVACKTQARNAPAGDVSKAERAAGGDNARERRATRVGRAENTAYAGSRDVRDGDLILFEDLQNA